MTAIYLRECVPMEISPHFQGKVLEQARESGVISHFCKNSLANPNHSKANWTPTGWQWSWLSQVHKLTWTVKIYLKSQKPSRRSFALKINKEKIDLGKGGHLGVYILCCKPNYRAIVPGWSILRVEPGVPETLRCCSSLLRIQLQHR